MAYVANRTVGNDEIILAWINLRIVWRPSSSNSLQLPIQGEMLITLIGACRCYIPDLQQVHEHDLSLTLAWQRRAFQIAATSHWIIWSGFISNSAFAINLENAAAHSVDPPSAGCCYAWQARSNRLRRQILFNVAWEIRQTISGCWSSLSFVLPLQSDSLWLERNSRTSGLDFRETWT